MEEDKAAEEKPTASSRFQSRLLLTDEEIRAKGVRESEIEMYRR